MCVNGSEERSRIDERAAGGGLGGSAGFTAQQSGAVSLPAPALKRRSRVAASEEAGHNACGSSAKDGEPLVAAAAASVGTLSVEAAGTLGADIMCSVANGPPEDGGGNAAAAAASSARGGAAARC
jgi:hypothetical protein